jgi:hypothetical protein
MLTIFYTIFFAFQLLAPFLDVGEQVRSNQPSYIKFFALLSTAIVNCNYFFVEYDGTAALSSRGTDAISNFKILWFKDNHPKLPFETELAEFDRFSFNIAGFEVLIRQRIPENTQLLVFTFQANFARQG